MQEARALVREHNLRLIENPDAGAHRLLRNVARSITGVSATGAFAGVIVGALLIYYVIFNILPGLPQQAVDFANSIGAANLNSPSGDWPGLAGEVQRLKYLIFGLILVLTMLLRPQGLLPSRQRAEELQKGVHDDTTIEDVNAETGTA